MKKYHLTFNFYNSIEEAKAGINKIKEISKKKNNYLYNKNKNIKILDWISLDGKENKKIVWYYA